MNDATHSMALGDKMKIELLVTLKARDPEGVDFNIEAAVPPGYELDERAEEEPGAMHMASTTDSLMTPAAMMVRKKKASERDSTMTGAPAIAAH